MQLGVHALVHVSAYLRAVIPRPHSSPYLASHMLVPCSCSSSFLPSCSFHLTPTGSDVEMMKNARLLSREGAFACFSASVCVFYLSCTDVYDQQSGANGTSLLESASVLPSHYQASARLHDFSLVHIVGLHVYGHVFTLVRSFALGTSACERFPLGSHGN